jgi:hypothetical protein
MRLRNPWVRLRLLRWGWNVLFTTSSELELLREGTLDPSAKGALR